MTMQLDELTICSSPTANVFSGEQAMMASIYLRGGAKRLAV